MSAHVRPALDSGQQVGNLTQVQECSHLGNTQHTALETASTALPLDYSMFILPLAFEQHPERLLVNIKQFTTKYESLYQVLFDEGNFF